MKIVIQYIWKGLLAVVSGLFLSLITVVGLDAVLANPNPFNRDNLNLWLVGFIVAVWLFLMLWLMLRKWSGGPVITTGIDLLPLSISEMIDSVIEAMGYRKSVRAEVRQELTDHFTDALKQCQNETEQHKRAQELVAEFGDVKVLGKLIRRGKKRCRPLWRTMVVRGFQAAGVLLVLLVLYIGWFFTGKPVITTNYVEVLNKMVRPEADESQNARPFYAEAMKVFVEPGPIGEATQSADNMQPQPAFDTSLRNVNSLSAKEKQVLVQWLTDNKETMELIRQGNTKPYFWREYSTENDTTEVIAVLLPDLRFFKSAATMFCWNALWQAEKGHLDKAFESVFDGYNLAKHVRKKELLLDQLVVIAMESLTTKTMRLLLDENIQKLDSGFLNSVRQQFASLIANEEFAIKFDSEKLLMYDELQRSFTSDFFGGHIYLRRINELGSIVDELSFSPKTVFSGFYMLFLHPDKESTLRKAEQCYNELDRLAEYTPASLRSQGIDLNARISNIVEGNLFLGMITPALDKVIQLGARNKADVQAALAIMAVLENQKKTGSLPASLDVLVESGLLKQVPIDPFSDKPLVYKLTDTGFTLYSVGHNFEDDGGVYPKVDNSQIWHEDGDAVFWPVREQGKATE